MPQFSKTIFWKLFLLKIISKKTIFRNENHNETILENKNRKYNATIFKKIVLFFLKLFSKNIIFQSILEFSNKIHQ
jgi:hypothetical protein